MKEAGFNVTHVYGLTETYGPATVNEWRAAGMRSPAEQAAKKARQGVRYVPLEALDVRDPDTMAPVPRGRREHGRGDVPRQRGDEGLSQEQSATEKAFAGGWFHSGDLGVMHPDGYIQLKDRSKDIIISGGENISSIEVEDALYKHPAVQAAAVVAKPDEKWGETPCAFVELKPGETATTDELIAWCRKHLAGYKCPRYVVFARTAEDLDRQDPEVQAARDGEGGVSVARGRLRPVAWQFERGQDLARTGRRTRQGAGAPAMAAGPSEQQAL